MIKKILICTAFLLLLSDEIFPQHDPSSKPVPVTIEKKDATILKGKLLGVENDSVKFLDQNNMEYRIAMKEIRNIDYQDSKMRRKIDWPTSPNTTRYLFSSTAYMLKKKEISLQSTYLFINSAHVGVTDRFSIGGGGDLLGGSILFLNTKVNLLNREKHKFSAGISYYRLPADFIKNFSGEDVRDLGMIYGASTWGNQNNHLTIGAGYVYLAKGFLPPIVNLSGTTRIARRFAFVTENWFLFVGERTGIPVIVSLGVRYISNRSTFDLAFFSDHESAFGTSIPYINYTFKIGRYRVN